MGCNTSKQDAVQPGEEKEKEVPNGDVKNEATESKEEEKSPSAKTITIKPAESKEEEKQKEAEKGESKKEENKADEKEEEGELEHAATKIQAAFRGHQTRKSMKQGDQPAASAANNDEPTREELEAEFRADDKELCHAATKIQASFRGHMARKNKEKGEDEKEHKTQGVEEEELDIDLTDPELNKAAIKIQASFRGHMVRKDVDEGNEANETN